jgi:hypothetical protein
MRDEFHNPSHKFQRDFRTSSYFSSFSSSQKAQPERRATKRQRGYPTSLPAWEDGFYTREQIDALFLKGTKVTAPVTLGQNYTDIDISEYNLSNPPSQIYILGVTKPNDAAYIIGALSVSAPDTDTIRVYFQGSPTETGYTVTVLFSE